MENEIQTLQNINWAIFLPISIALISAIAGLITSWNRMPKAKYDEIIAIQDKKDEVLREFFKIQIEAKEAEFDLKFIDLEEQFSSCKKKIDSQEKLIVEKDQMIDSLQKKLQQRDEAIAKQLELIEQLKTQLTGLEKRIAELEK